MTTTTQLTSEQVKDHMLAALGHVPARVAADLADRFAATVAAFRPGAVVGSDVGVVRHRPDSRFPDHPFVREYDEVRLGWRDLGEIHMLRPEPGYGHLGGGWQA